MQGPRVEIIEDFKEIVKESLRFFKQKNGFLPDKILYYRDGVSEGQFQQVMGTERQAMVKACTEIEQGYEKKVKITIIVVRTILSLAFCPSAFIKRICFSNFIFQVQKRHHTRFFPGKTEIGKGDKRNNNVPAGTIVDTEIVHPHENHFYLVSHASIQGVAKPTKVLQNVNNNRH